MSTTFAQATQVVTTETVSSWVNTPMAVALLFALAGAVFIGIYAIRRIRGIAPSDGSVDKNPPTR